MRTSRSNRGFTLIELSIVLTLITIIGAVALPSLLNALDRGRQSSTLNDIRAIGNALERYAADHYGYPVVDDVEDLRAKLQPGYLKKVPLADGWKHPFVFEVDDQGSTYTLLSPGKDGVVQPADERVEISHHFNADIVCVDGVLVQRPLGEQG